MSFSCGNERPIEWRSNIVQVGATDNRIMGLRNRREHFRLRWEAGELGIS